MGPEYFVLFDGQMLTVPDDPSNYHRQLIEAWVAAGNTISAYEE
jgi:hypothetical protein